MICKECNVEYVEVAPDQPHDYIQCLETRLTNSKIEIAVLKRTVESWKDAWYDMRRAVGKAAWEVPNPLYLKSNVK